MRSELVMEPETLAVERAPERGIPLWRYVAVIALLLATVPLVKMADNAQVGDEYARAVGLNQLPRQVAEWTGKDHTLDKVSLAELEPDDYLWRIYEDPNQIPLDLMVIYGHLKKTFHAPDFCLPGGGWQIVRKTEESVSTAGVPMRMSVFKIQAQIEGQTYQQMVLYAYLQGDNSTPSLVGHNWNLLKAHIQRDRSTGTFLRVVIPVVSTDEAAVARAKAFVTQIYPDLRKRVG